MTNRDKIVKELINHESGAYLYFLCPYIPGEPGAHCKTGEEADGQTFCRSCIEEWLDREIEAPKEDANEYYSKMLAAVPDIPDNESERRCKRILLENAGSGSGYPGQ